jgi:hypothetical protein
MAPITSCPTKLLLYLGRAIGSFEDITHKRCIIHKPEMDWFKDCLVGHRFWKLQPSKHEGWAQDKGPAVREHLQDALYKWRETTYPGTLPYVFTDDDDGYTLPNDTFEIVETEL